MKKRKSKPKSPANQEPGGDCPSAPCSSFREDWLSAVDRLESLQQHLEGIAEKLIEVREELADESNDFRLIPLSHEDSGVVLAICEGIGADLIPLKPWTGSLFLCFEQLRQLNEAMADYIDQPAKNWGEVEMTTRAILAEQDLAQVRKIIEKGGSCEEVLAFLDTPRA